MRYLLASLRFQEETIDMEIQFDQLKTAGSSTPLTIEKWHITPNQSWAVFSTEGDVGSLLGGVLCDTLPFEGTLTKSVGKIVQVSLREQQKLLEQELANDDTDFLDRIDTGTTVHDLIFDMCGDETLCDTLIAELDLDHLKNSGFRVLSTGETRRLMLARAWLPSRIIWCWTTRMKDGRCTPPVTFYLPWQTGGSRSDAGGAFP